MEFILIHDFHLVWLCPFFGWTKHPRTYFSLTFPRNSPISSQKRKMQQRCSHCKKIPITKPLQYIEEEDGKKVCVTSKLQVVDVYLKPCRKSGCNRSYCSQIPIDSKDCALILRCCKKGPENRNHPHAAHWRDDRELYCDAHQPEWCRGCLRHA